MNDELLNLLACPNCKHGLDMVGNASHGSSDSFEETVSELVCDSCHNRYTVSDGIPDLRLPPVDT